MSVTQHIATSCHFETATYNNYKTLASHSVLSKKEKFMPKKSPQKVWLHLKSSLLILNDNKIPPAHFHPFLYAVKIQLYINVFTDKTLTGKIRNIYPKPECLWLRIPLGLIKIARQKTCICMYGNQPIKTI